MENQEKAPALAGRVAVVTGAGGVLGSGFARCLARAGARVALVDLHREKAEAVAAELRAAGCPAAAFGCNVLDQPQVAETAEAVAQRRGPCDILINAAGGNHPKATTASEYALPNAPAGDGPSFFDLDAAGVSFVFHLNFLGTLLPCQAFGRQMLGRAGCSIVNISSMNAYRPLTKIPAYSGAKAAVSNFTQWLAVHFSKAGVRVNALAPGFFSTAQNKALLWQDDGTPTARSRKILDATPLGRFGTSEDLDGALLFLTDPQASAFVTGVVLPVDGGFAAYAGV